MNFENGFYRLIGKVQNYSWGGYSYIPNLIGFKPDTGIAYAEYWMGAHDKSPSEIQFYNGRTVLLNDIISRHTVEILGVDVAKRYKRLPFLFKVLDVREPLSIQVHPSKLEAEAGFAKENSLGLPLDSLTRNYRDNNHKPEIMVALSDFWLLHGFLLSEQLLNTLSLVPEFNGFRNIFIQGGYYGLYRHVMEMSTESVETVLKPLIQRIYPKYKNGRLDKSSADYWAARVSKGNLAEPFDRGIFSIYFFNIVKLKKGQAIFHGPGIPHAYLEGKNVELMANSDNVLRGGLTKKHVDVNELLGIIRFEGVLPQVNEGVTKNNPCEVFYESPACDFLLSRIELRKGSLYENYPHSVEIIITLHGEIRLINEKCLPNRRGDAAIIFSKRKYQIDVVSDEVQLYKASIPNYGYS